MTTEDPTGPAEARILIVDDQELNVILLERILRDAGFEDIRTTTDSVAAVDLYASYRPHVLLLDLAMPRLDGIGVLKQLWERSDVLGPPCVLVITAAGSADSERRAMDAGASDFLTKPFEIGELEARVRALLRSRRD